MSNARRLGATALLSMSHFYKQVDVFEAGLSSTGDCAQLEVDCVDRLKRGKAFEYYGDMQGKGSVSALQ